MGKHDSGYARVARDYYPTPDWPVDVLAEHIVLKGRDVWECACGDGRMSEALKRHGARVRSTDIEDRGYAHLDALMDFTAPPTAYPRNHRIIIITNPPLGDRKAKFKLGVDFIVSGLRYLAHARRGLLALLLPADFDSAKTRRHLFADCDAYVAKIVLTRRIVWIPRTDGKRPAPKGNHAWFLWRLPRPAEHRILLYDALS
jgi:hypothetical protein